MKASQSVQEAPVKEPSPKPGERHQATLPQAAESQWQFKLLIAVITLCVLMLVGKIFGLF